MPITVLPKMTTELICFSAGETYGIVIGEAGYATDRCLLPAARDDRRSSLGPIVHGYALVAQAGRLAADRFPVQMDDHTL